MKLVDRKTGKVFSGALVDTGKGYGYPVLELTACRGDQKITVAPADAGSLCLIEATLTERAFLDRTGYFLPVKIRRHWPSER
jgi:hypothetical protein